MLIPSIEIPGAASVNEADNAFVIDFAKHAGVIGPVLMRLPTGFSGEESVVDLISCLVHVTPAHIDGFDVDNDELVTSLLDDGLNVAYFNITEEHELLRQVLKSLPRSRVGLSMRSNASSLEEIRGIVEEYREVAGHFIFKLDDGQDLTILQFIKELINEPSFAVQVNIVVGSNHSDSDVVAIGTAHHAIGAIFTPRIESSTQQTILRNPYAVSIEGTRSDFDLVRLYFGCLRSDRGDKLVTTVVCDEHGICLGLVYSNEQSLRVAICEMRGVYWSRSRGGLWRKGDSSGMHQELLSIRVDCDADALRFQVVQKGDPPAFCHLMTRTCWGPVQGMQKLESILQDRRKSAPEGSYTKRLFDDPDLLRKKLLEEVQELVEAVEPDHVAAEAADVLYFTMARCAAAGVGLREIEDHLDRRTLKVTRRPGNAKAWRTQNAEEILQSQKVSSVSVAQVVKEGPA